MNLKIFKMFIYSILLVTLKKRRISFLTPQYYNNETNHYQINVKYSEVYN